MGSPNKDIAQKPRLAVKELIYICFTNISKIVHSLAMFLWKSLFCHAGTVKVHKIVTGKTFGADEALLKQLNCKELQVKMTDRQGCDIIILFCPISSRVGSDVDLAMRQVSGEERVILILMHHTRDVDYSTAAKRWSETFDNVVFDINVLYHETVPGLLTCPKNTEAISDIRKELMQYSSNTNEGFLHKVWKPIWKLWHWCVSWFNKDQ